MAAATHPGGGARRPRRRRRLARQSCALGTSAAVTAATAPITAWHFHEVSFGGVLGNLVATPLVELVVIPLGLAGMALAALVPPVGGVVIDVSVALAGVGARLVAALGACTPSLAVPPPSPLELVACAALYAAWAGARTGWLPARRAALLAAVAGLGLAGAWAAHDRGRVASDDLRVTFLDVGQGDAAVIELPGGEVWVVDAGGAPGALGDLRATARPGEVVARYLRTRRIARVDVAVVSHPHPDHYLGLVALAARVPVARLWSAAEEPPLAAVDPAAPRERPRPRSGADPGFAAIAAWLEATGTVHDHPALGAHRRGDVTIRVLAPVHDPGGGPALHAAADPVRSLNDNSLVLVIERAGRCVLFTGDLEAEGEADLVAAGIGACDVVKVAHHGSPTSSTPAFVAATRPALAVMSLGRANRFGFPGPEVVTRWQAAGARVLRTDQVGAVTVTIDRAGALVVSTHDPAPAPAAALGGRSERQGGEGSVIMWP
ncbi:MAG: ComEC/Rec2 family competence protein [Kofleriaceae bacterium]|nr:ComEC/Rec2 family competence protein [Kofleriaceae bacterium]